MIYITKRLWSNSLIARFKGVKLAIASNVRKNEGNNMATKSAKDVAKVLLKLSEPDSGDVLTNLKIQKLLYYVQGFHLALKERPLFKEDILRWQHGPVVREVYDEYRSNGANVICIPEDFEPSMFIGSEIELITEVNKVYGQFSGWKLRDMTHNEKPWKDTGENEVIDPELMKSYFKTLLV